MGGAESFVLAICSSKEVAAVKKILSPAKEKITKGHLIDIIDNGEGRSPQMLLRSVDGKGDFTKSIEEGSFIINCTDHMQPSGFGPILSEDEGCLVLRPQNACGFSGISANYLTHLWYLNKLEPIWRDFPRLMIDRKDKSRAGFDLLVFVMLQSHKISKMLPKEIRDKYVNSGTNLPLHRLLPAGIRWMKALSTIAE